jgi:hypothetical protein
MRAGSSYNGLRYANILDSHIMALIGDLLGTYLDI